MMLPAWLPTAIFIAAAFGPISHYAFWVRFEFDGIIDRYVPWVLLSQALSFFFLNYIGLTVVESTLVFTAIQATYLVTVFTSISLYRLFFHPTRIYPGPFWARLWSWWKVKAFIDHREQGYAVLHELHQKYGDVVRIGPRQISVNNVDAIADIYGSASQCFRSAQSEMAKEKDLQALRNFDEHKARRKLWDQGLNAKGKRYAFISAHTLILTGVVQVCQEYLPRMNRLSDLLVAKLSQYDGMPVVINDWCHFVTFDIMGELGFGQSYGQLESGQLHEAIFQITKFLRIAVSAIQVPWLVNIIQSIPGLEDPQRLLRNFSERCLDEREKNEPDTPDIMSYIIRGKDMPSRWPIDRDSLIDDARTMQIAGSDTSYSALVHIFYYLALHPALQSRLHAEILPALSPRPTSNSESNSALNWPSLSTAPLLDSIITETMRMHPPVPMGLTRETPLYPSNQPTKIGPYMVPGETMLSVPTWSVQHDERNFERAHEWVPERWTSRPEMVRDRRAWVPFSMGRTVCAGKYFALMEMKVVVAKVVEAFEIGFPEGEGVGKGEKGDWKKEWLDGNKDFFTLWLPDLRLCLVPRAKK